MKGLYQVQAAETISEIREAFLAGLSNVTKGTEGWTASCPAPGHGQGRGDRNPSLSVDEGDDGLLVNCFAGCPTESVVEAIGWTMADLFPRKNRKVIPINRTKDETNESFEEAGYLGCTLEQYAADKRLPKEWLEQEFGLSDMPRHPKTKEPAVVIPYLDEQGREITRQYRTALRKPERGKDQRFLFRTGAKPKELLYGLEKLAEIKEDARYVVLVEGPSDVHTLRHHSIHALAVPAAGDWDDAHAGLFEGIGKVYVVVEHDRGGDTLRDALSASPLKDKLWFLDFGEYDDPSGLHVADPGKFRTRFAEAVKTAVPYTDEEEEKRQERIKGLWEECKNLALSGDILAEFEKDLKNTGVVGQEKETKIIFLAAITRHLALPTSVIIKGPSSAGKSFVLNKVLDFVPQEGYYKLTAMSDKALAHFSEPLSHRHLVIAEAAALEESHFANYLLRTLLSEGYVHYVFPEPTNDGIVMREVHVDGPTGLFMTTTELSLHDENETRYLSIGINDTREHTSAVMYSEAVAREKQSRGEADSNSASLLQQWHALAGWIALAGNKRVYIPYAKWLARQIPPEAVRLRRDFPQIMNLIEAHAILHQVNRETNEYGALLATRDDYAAVFDLLSDLISEQLEASVPPVVRETVEKVRELFDDLEDKTEGVSAAKLREELELDKNATARRLRMAITRGFIKNLEEKKGKSGRYVPGDPLPDDVAVLPHPGELNRTTVPSDSGDSGGDENTPVVSEEGEGVFRPTPETPGTRGTVVRPHTADSMFEESHENGESLGMVRRLNEDEISSEGSAPSNGKRHGTPEQEEQIRTLIDQGMDAYIARAEVLGEEEEGIEWLPK